MNNLLSDCGQHLLRNDFRLIEQDLSVTLPEELKEIYIKCNGGVPENTVWVDPSEEWDDVIVANLIPMLYDRRNAGEKAFTVENVARTEWKNNRLPQNFLPFAIDHGANFFCIDIQTKKIYYFVRDVWNDSISIEKNFEINTRYIASSLSEFMDGLLFDEDLE